jgi:hypothetical protein
VFVPFSRPVTQTLRSGHKETATMRTTTHHPAAVSAHTVAELPTAFQPLGPVLVAEPGGHPG